MKIALLSVSEESAWRSSRMITTGLRNAYLAPRLAATTSEYQVSDFDSHEDLRNLADRIFETTPEIISFIDTLACYGPILHRLTMKYASHERRPLLRFHVYGDFTVRSYIWRHWENDLKNFNVEFACASEKQQKLVSAAITDGEKLTWLCPFALESERYPFNPARRLKIRHKLRLKPKEKLILYAGRLSMQKNIPALIRAFAQMNDRNCRLVLAGEFDDIGTPASSKRVAQGRLLELINNEIAALPPDIQSKVSLLQGLSPARLLDMYNAADVYFSASLQHDEDFGIAPAEAAINGLSLVLTDWGGFSDLRKAGARGSWIPVNISDDGATFDLIKASEALADVLATLPTQAKRRAHGAKAAKYLSVSAATSRLRKRNQALPQKRSETRFGGFKNLTQELATLFNAERGHLVFDRFGQGSTYEQVYKNYV